MSECSVCAWERGSGQVVDTSKPGREWARIAGVSEASIRRHLKHPPSRPFAGAPSESETHRPDGSADYTTMSDSPWGYDDFCEFIRSKGQDPDEVEFTWGVTSAPSGGFWNKLNNVRPKPRDSAEYFTLDEAYRRASEWKVPSAPLRFSQTGLVVAISDYQIGKTGKRGGTPELLVRIREAREAVKGILESGSYDQILFLDGGDLIENFESGGNPMFTNDLSLPDMLDVAATEIFEWVSMLSEYAPVQAATVPSNHSAWRRGKQVLGRPSDDFGIFVFKQVEKMVRASGATPDWIQFHYPEEYDESVCVDFMGTPIGMAHGNQFAPGKAIDWWQGQAFGSQAVSRADVFLSGHYHTLGLADVAENPFTGNQRYWIGLPTLDSGSDWFRNAKGRESIPGTVTFEVTPDGFDLGSFRVV